MDLVGEDIFSLEELEEFTRKVYEGGYRRGQWDKKRTSGYAKTLFEGVNKGFSAGGGNVTLDYTTPDGAMLEALKDNVFMFSASKSAEEILTLSRALRDEKGKLRSYKDFRAEASKILPKFQEHHLRVEYDMAVNASTMAARWVDYSEDPDTILVYRTANDSRVRPEHAAMEGIAKPVNDPFWDLYYPPNGWNCRCTVEPSISGAITPDEDIPSGAADGVPPAFRNNFAKNGWVFDVNRTKELRKIMPIKRRVIYTSRSGGKVYQSGLVNQLSPDYREVKTTAMLFADRGSQVEICPNLHTKDARYDQFFGALRNTRFNNKCPDLLIDGHFYEFEGYNESGNTSNRLRNMISRGARQSKRVIIREDGSSLRHKQRYIENAVSAEKVGPGRNAYNKLQVEEIWVLSAGGLNKIWPR